MSISLRAMTTDDIEQGFVMTQHLKWPHRREDWLQAVTLGKGVVAEEEGIYLGSAIGWRWGEQAATIGLVIVNDQFQGRGIGKQLMLALLEKFPGYNVRLHATEMGKGLYLKLGFEVTGHIQQHQTKALTAMPTVNIPTGLRLRNAAPNDASILTELDQQAHGMWRPRMIETLIADSQTVILQDERQRIHGFASLRRFGHGWAIGPVIALNLSAAQALVAVLMQGLSGEFVRIDINDSQQLADWLEAHGLVQVDAPTTMVRGIPWLPPVRSMQAFGLMTQAMA
ncbi:GNAT family N-acetyltransferase [Pantoea dispersa]|uniref:GNAT family N-acetyltransferase n=1 Tax=Pantoea dispersa TaxID=59814 RepID=UPI0024AFD6DA|nr:GNAT family N-acetyltransferase [Pantoea dispersa]MDI6636444.1 GNAT family N-acetyltransferase [Pantoea dispersa]